MRKRCNRRRLIPVAPAGLRPKLDRAQLTKLGMYHVQNLDAIASGEAGVPMLWDFLEEVLTWWKVAQLLGMGELEMEGQLQIGVRLAERWARTGAVRFDGPDYQAAKLGVQIMDTLAAEVDTVKAWEAAYWCTLELARIQRLVVEERHALQKQQEQRAA